MREETRHFIARSQEVLPQSWSGNFLGRKLLSGAKYLIKEGELIFRNLNYSDAGPYTCAARNILGSSEAISNLTVRGKRNTVLLLYLAA